MITPWNDDSAGLPAGARAERVRKRNELLLPSRRLSAGVYNTCISVCVFFSTLTVLSEPNSRNRTRDIAWFTRLFGTFSSGGKAI